MRKPDFNELLKVLKREKPFRPVLFEFFMNDKIYQQLTGEEIKDPNDNEEKIRISIKAFHAAGYDYATLPTWFYDGMKFVTADHEKKSSISLNEGFVITDRKSFEEYSWPDPEKGDYSAFERNAKFLPEGMKFIGCGPGGVLENVISLVGYERLCYMLYEDEQLVQNIFDAVGSRLVGFYKIISPISSIGALIVNDDWGFKTQTMLDTDLMRKYIIPWHKKIVEVIHGNGKPAILHSCGNLAEVMDDIIDVIKFDAKHSYEDTIIPVEEAYDKWGSRIAIMGGIDVDYLCRHTPEEVNARAKALVLKTGCKGYALGSGNSIPEFVPAENYLAMIKAAQ
jgi:uroporphyrinogen decarboxylase